MKKVTCTRPNASEEINGIPFVRNEDDSVSAVVSDEDAKQFEGFDGYTVEDAQDDPAKTAKPAKAEHHGKSKEAPAA